jgi:predicted alpha/beta hydrolase family esterase
MFVYEMYIINNIAYNYKMIIKTISALITILIILLLLILVTFQESLIYPGMKRPGEILKEPFEQIHDSFYKKGSTGKIWIFFGGNGSLPIDYINGIKLIKEDHSFLIITYPGYNGTKTKLTPGTTNALISKCIEELNNRGYQPKDINFMCYSIGCAIAINYLSDHPLLINKLILLAPFWSLDEIVHSKYPFPIFLIKKLINHNWENERLKNVHSKIDITIIHGKQDKLIDYSHSQRLSEVTKCKLILTEYDDHQSIYNKIPEYINFQLL